MVNELTEKEPQQYWIDGPNELGVPLGPVNKIEQVCVDLIGSPIKLSKIAIDYCFAPPNCGQDTDAVLSELLSMGDDEINQLRCKRIT